MSSNHKTSSNSDPVRLLEPAYLMEPLNLRDGFFDPPASSVNRPPISHSASNSGPDSTVRYVRPRAGAPTSVPARWASQSVLMVVGALTCFGAGVALPRVPGIALDHGQSSDSSQASPPPVGSTAEMEPWSPEKDFANASIPVPNKTKLVTPSPLPQTVLPRMQLKSRTVENESSRQESKLSSEGKLTTSAIEGRSPQALPATKYRTKGDTTAMPGSNSVHQALPSSSADAALELHDSRPPTFRERHFAAGVHVSTCFPSASAVRQDYPEAWPSWTLRASGHEGTRCWYAAPRATAHARRGDTETVGTLESLGSPR
jgi:hypothetical protein